MSAQAPCVAVAYSGGRDSSALLHATLAAAASLGVEVVALHVHHGLRPNADAWLAHCDGQCRRWRARGHPVRFDFKRLAGRPARGESVEAWARRERYAALRSLALNHGAPLVLLAHHEQDQAETFLLQALRGAGVAGLAAMPLLVERDGIFWARPWLHCSRASIVAYARRHRLRHVEDDSNADARFARNRLRARVWPALESEFARAAHALSDSAAWAGEARVCADALAGIDLARVAPGPELDLAAWSRIEPAARRSNALRAWIKARTGAAPPAALVERLLVELPATAPAAWNCGSHRLRRYRGHLRIGPRSSEPAAGALATDLALSRGGTYRVPGWTGRLIVRRVASGGVALACLAGLRLVPRSGGEQFQTAPGRPPRSLKKCFQAAAVPEWRRAGPLICAGEALLYVPGLGIDARALAADGEAQVSFEWRADAGG